MIQMEICFLIIKELLKQNFLFNKGLDHRVVILIFP